MCSSDLAKENQLKHRSNKEKTIITYKAHNGQDLPLPRYYKTTIYTDDQRQELQNKWQEIENRIQISRESIEQSNIKAAAANADKAVEDWKIAVLDREFLYKTQENRVTRLVAEIAKIQKEGSLAESATDVNYHTARKIEKEVENFYYDLITRRMSAEAEKETAGIYVRGGTPDQNLILLDGVPVYNASHMLGFFSVFNADAINSTQIYKGGFPARYGERLSSVIDVRMKEGNMQKYEGEFAIGLISSKLSVSGPIVKDKTSFIVSARRTYADLLIKGAELLNKVKDDDNSNNDVANIYFYDINAKVNHKFSDTDRLYLSYYGGKDITKAETKDTYTEGTSTTNDKTSLDLSWGNTIGAVRWNHIFSPQLFANTTATYTRYSFNVNTDFKSSTTNSSSDPKYNRSSSSFFSGIDDLGAKVDFDYFPSTAHAIKLGASATYHTFTPSASESSVINEDDPSSNIKQKERKKTYAKELAIYAEDTYDINQTLSLNAGVRGSLFLVDGASYHAVEPRLSFNIKTTESSSVKLSYVEMTQYLHFLTSGSMALPSDLWVPTTSKVKPQRSKQVALGITKTLNKYNLTLETYYKKMDRIIEYKDGAYFDENDTS